MELYEDRAGERVWELMERALLLVSPAPCPYAVAGELAMDQPRPPRIPPLLHNLHLHEGHRCPTEATLTRVCEQRGYLKAQEVSDDRTEHLPRRNALPAARIPIPSPSSLAHAADALTFDR